MSLPFTNATVVAARMTDGIYAPIPGRTALPVYVSDVEDGAAYALLGTAQQAELQLKWQPTLADGATPTDLRVGDRILGWAGSSAALYLERTAYRSGIPGRDYWVGKLVALPSRCDVLQRALVPDGGGGGTTTFTPTQTDVPCSLVANVGGSTTTEQESDLVAVSAWIITVPLGTAIGVRDQIRIGAGLYFVRALLNNPAAVAWAIPLLCWQVQ